MLSRLFIAAFSSPAGKGLTSWPLFMTFNCVFVTFLCDVVLDCIDSQSLLPFLLWSETSMPLEIVLEIVLRM